MRAETNTVMVVGYNARPIACLCKQLGFQVIAVDYWGDLDIKHCTDFLYTVLKQKSGEQLDSEVDKPCSELLVNLAEEAATKFDGKIDFILVGSGLDDRPDLWEKLQQIAPILGNSPERLKNIRRLDVIFDIAEEEGVKFPITERACSVGEAIEMAKNIGFPVVLKPISGSGGFRIRLARNPAEVEKYFEGVAAERGEAWVQEYISGVNASSSVLGNGESCIVVTVNEQLIGVKELGCLTPFGYCGNIVPLKANSNTINRIKQISSILGARLKLIGSNGFDYVIGQGSEPYLMEVNPRFQATMECIKYVTGLNLVEEHIKACHGELPMEIPKPTGYAVKMIVFAKEKSIIPDLSEIAHIVDIPHPGIVVNEGNPICTVQLFSQSRDEAVKKAFEVVSKIYAKLFAASL